MTSNGLSEKRLKILFAIPRFSVGGAEKLLVHQLSALGTQFEPSLITLFDEQKDTLADKVRIDRNFHFRSTWDISAFFHLVSYLRKEQFDVVVTSLFSANLLVRSAAILARVPVIVSYEHNIYPNKRRWQILMDKLLSFWTARVIVDSGAARTFTARQENIPLEKFVTLFIPPLLERREPRDAHAMKKELGIPDGCPVVLTVSRLVDDKGHTYLIDAAKNVIRRHPDAYFLIVGWGPLDKELCAQAEKLGIARRVGFPGRLDIQDVLPLADIYVDPAVSTDLPVAIMEAMRAGKPIVSTNIGDIPVFIEHGITGLIAEPRDSSMFAKHIETLLSDSALCTRLGDAAQERVKKYSLPEYMKSFEALIMELYEAAGKN